MEKFNLLLTTPTNSMKKFIEKGILGAKVTFKKNENTQMTIGYIDEEMLGFLVSRHLPEDVISPTDLDGSLHDYAWKVTKHYNQPSNQTTMIVISGIKREKNPLKLQMPINK